MTYLRNCWYMAGWGEEIEEGALLARTFLEEPVVIFRDSDGVVQAVRDQCPHRFAPLSRGKVVEGALVCGYHGLAFNGEGRCVRNPHGPVLGNMTVRHYPMLEAYRALWIWMGEPDAASPALLRRLEFLAECPDTAFSTGYLCGEGNYQLFTDNILDLTHADYLHEATLGSGALTRTKAKIGENDDRIVVQYDFSNEVPSPVEKAMFHMGDDDRVDTWMSVDWSAPAIMTLDATTGPTGTPRDRAGQMISAHIMTPETEHTTHYFFAQTRNFLIEDATLNARLGAALTAAFTNEDKPMIAAQQAVMGDRDFWEMDPLLLRIDEGGVRARRKLAKLIKSERPGQAEQSRASELVS